ncbi:hypothetical protein FAY30_23265 [Bacillus sp. S3]|uniref:hypothetical protein n=1 Tax=Bacillus sp. S3 TaxID=486398 RepID=UPI00118D2400|nr:hypothetical protein [Bacillus sp. S3]QCJ44573.1 hypothetical protein FAY30_23265 [Bacillus sp. S3]
MKKILVLVLFLILFFSIVSRCSKLSSNLQFGEFNSLKDGDYLKIMVDITNTSSRSIDGSFFVNLLDKRGNKVRKVYFQFPEGGIKPKETNKFSIEVKDVEFSRWNQGYVYLKDSRTELLWKLVFFIILVIPIYILLRRKILNKNLC